MRHIRYISRWGFMRISRLAILPLAAGLTFGGVAGNAAAAPVVTDVLATLLPGSVPNTVVVDGASNVYTLNPPSRTISKISFDGTLTPAWASFPAGTAPSEIVTTTDGTVYTANLGTATISRVMPDGTVTPIYASLAPLSQPVGLAIANDGTLFTANQASNSISRVSPTGIVTASFALLTAGSKPFDIVVTPTGDLYTLNLNNSVSKVSSAGMVTPAFATLAAGVNPVNLMVSSTGHVFVLEQMTNQIEEFDTTGARVRTIPLPTQPGQIAMDAQDNLFVSLRGTKTIGFIPNGGSLVPSIATLNPGADYGPLAITTTNTVYAVGLSQPIVSRISLGAKITSAPVSGKVESGKPFSATVTASGYEPMAFSLTGTVPPGVSINRATGVISGPSTTVGTYRFSVLASNMFGASSTQEATLTVTAAPVPTPTPTGTASPGPGPGPASGAGSGSAGSESNGGGRAAGASGSLANTGATFLLPGTLALLLSAAGVVGLVTERRRRHA
ncbi:putative Ig domain-containing protein [Herbiconiux sp. CPCC 205763]|uniref:Ig domain-containing protein n=1 Tax=Herbiconiux aconitum TaxID=2970913 RepID=A0ABT2GQP0_9MICO|nr:putative Ig domain-containing protein [Herbiconiux aconitum]MCS5718539.1 putative Ig domain-containing protein [Herbiconiux aconitum]